jgi:hypothetical protein
LPDPIFHPNLEEVNRHQEVLDELYEIYGFDGFDEYLIDLESEINSGIFSFTQKPPISQKSINRFDLISLPLN